MSETGGDPDATAAPTGAPRAQPVNPDDEGTGTARGQLSGPGAVQDEEASREKLLKAADQIDLMESNSEANKAALDALKTQLAQLQDTNTALKLQVSTLQDTVQRQQETLDRMQADRLKERQALIDEVSALVAGKSSPHKARHADDDASPASNDTAPPPRKTAPADSLAPPPDPATSPAKTTAGSGADEASASGDGASTEVHHPHKGYIYVVKAHETLTLIVEAYRAQGVKVTLAEVRDANNLTSKSVLHVGQKLFIPKPGT